MDDSNMPPPDTTISAFAQFGLAGLVILALFYLVFTHLNGMKALHDSFIAQIQKQSELHASERKQWYEVTERNNEVIRVFTSKLEQILSVQFEGRK